MQARDVMTHNVVTASPHTSVSEIARRLFEHRISAVPVVEADGRVVGIVSEGDLMRQPETGAGQQPSWWLRLFAPSEEKAHVYLRAHGRHAHEVMTRDLVTAAEDTPLQEVAKLLEKHRIKRVPVLRDGKLVGIVSRANLIQSLATRGRSHLPPAGDRQLREQVRNAIMATGAQSELVSVVVANGVVHLFGTTYSKSERDALRVAAEGVSGVKRVQNDVSILPPSVQASMWE